MWQFFVKNTKFTLVVVAALSLMGLVSMLTIEKEANPEVVIPIIVVSTPFPGASAVDVESSVTDEIEDAILGIEDLKQVTSRSSLGVSSVVAEFDVGINIDEKLIDVKDAVDLAVPSLPSEALDPIVQEVSFDDTPIKVYALAGPYDIKILKNAAEEIQTELERIPGITEVRITGGQEQQVLVTLKPGILDQYTLSLSAITGAIAQADSNIPIGTIEQGSDRISLRLDGSIETIDELSRIVVSAGSAVPVRLGDIAQIETGYSERTAISRLTNENVYAEESVTIAVLKKSGGNILNIVRDADAVVERMVAEELPEGMTAEVVDDTAKFIKDDLRNLSVSGLQTTLLVIIFIYLLLGWRESLLAGLAIPLTFLITFIFLFAYGFTLNFLSLFSLILSLGILVDAAIVVTEGLYANLEKGLSPMQASLETIDEFKFPLASGTLTTIFAFLPMMLTSGIIGQFIKSIPVTVSIVLLSALFVALAVIPTIAKHLLARSERPHKTFFLVRWLKQFLRAFGIAGLMDTIHHRKDDAFSVIQRWYNARILFFLTQKQAQKLLIGGLVLAFIGSLALPITGVLKVDMFPSIDEERVYVDVRLPNGTALHETEQRMRLIETYFSEREEVESFLVSAGSGSTVSGGSATHIGSVTVNFIDGERPDSRELLEVYEQALNPIVLPGKLTVQQLGSGPENGAPVEVEIEGPDLNTLEALAADMKDLVSEVEGTRVVESSVEETAGEFVFELRRDLLSTYGLTAIDIARELRTAVYGTDPLSLRIGQDDVDVIVKYDLGQDLEENAQNVSLEQLESITLLTSRGDIPLSTFVKTTYAPSRGAIEHEDGNRVVRVTSLLRQGVLAQDVFNAIEGRVHELELPPGYEVRLAGQNEDTDQSFADLGRAMILGIFLIAALLVLQFNSYKQPIYIITSIPLALTGVLGGLTLIGIPLSFPGMIGVVALAGIVVNNGIILVDKININLAAGSEMIEAVEEAAVSRLRPILLTTITTVMGLLPLVISQPSWAPLGFAIIFGLLFSTVLTLFLLPVLYFIFERKKVVALA